MAGTAEQIVPDRVDEDTLVQAVQSTLTVLMGARKDIKEIMALMKDVDPFRSAWEDTQRIIAGNHRGKGTAMKPLLSSLEGMTSMYMASQTGPHTAQSIRDIIAQLRDTPMFAGKVEDDDAEELARLIEEKYGISMGLGAIVDAEDFRPWLHDARINGEIGDFYWGRYRRLLNLKGLPKSVIDATDEVTDRVLDRLGNPNNMSPWSRRGMVVGHVQSGKTANYTGLICKAADAGYRLIVVIAGIHNNLRNQTQARIDEGFIGRDTGRLAHANKAQRQKIIGVGTFDQREFPVSLTNTLRDFNKATATTNTSQIGQYNVPVVLVIKKNSSTLKNLLEWLKEHSVHQGTQMVSQPMLLIDDEADNASINTAYARDEVTRINGQIRELLSLFHRSCYVGYTATPFANIFIDPDTDDEALKQDLFPAPFHHRPGCAVELFRRAEGLPRRARPACSPDRRQRGCPADEAQDRPSGRRAARKPRAGGARLHRCRGRSAMRGDSRRRMRPCWSTPRASRMCRAGCVRRSPISSAASGMLLRWMVARAGSAAEPRDRGPACGLGAGVRRGGRR